MMNRLPAAIFKELFTITYSRCSNVQRKHWFPLFFFFLFWGGCKDGPDGNRLAVDAFVEEQVEERLDVYQKILAQQCWDKILEEAGKIADSILINEARLKRDSIDKPPKPEKPERPEMKHLKDSLVLDPLFRDSITVEDSQ